MKSLKGVRVLVTGADGFIGSHLTERLVREGARVRATALYTSQGTWGWLDDLATADRESLDVRLGDIRDVEWTKACCAEIDVVFHLAALIAIPYSYTAPRSFIDTNVVGTLNVLEGARTSKVGRVIQTSTSEVYGTPASLPIRETHPLNAQSPYAASKVAADQLCLSYARSFGLPVTVLRPFNTYGPRQSTRAVLPTMLTQLIAGRKEIQLGRLDTRRDLTFVDDTVDGFIRAATADGIVGEVIQLGTGDAHSIDKLFQTACAATGNDARAIVDPRRMRPEASEVLVLESDPTEAHRRLGWSAKTSLATGIERTVSFLRKNSDRYKVDFLHV